MDVKEELVFVKIQKKIGGGGSGVGGGAGVGSVGGWLGSQGGCERRIKFFCENLKKKKNFFWGVGGSGWWGGWVRVDGNEELKFL